MAVKGAPKFDTLAVAELTVDFKGQGVGVSVKAAFVSSTTGHTHGWTQSNGPWTQRTQELLAQLRASLEADMGDKHFEGATDPTSGNVSSPKATGLGELLRDSTSVPATSEDAQQA